MDKLDNQTVINHLQEKFGEQVRVIAEPHGLLTVATEAETILDLLAFVKDDAQLRFNYLTDITAVHYPNEDRDFCVVYHLRSEEHTSELQSRENLVCRLLLEKKK